MESAPVTTSADLDALLPQRRRARVFLINTRSMQPVNLDKMDDLKAPGLPEVKVINLAPQVGSTRVDGDAGEWDVLVQLISDNYYDYNGFVIVHKTDSIVHAATALSFMLQNLGKPVIFTGSLIPSNLVHSDFKRNLVLSLLFAASGSISEVMILFAERMFRACRATKVSSVSLQPFASPHFPPLAYMRGKTLHLESSRLRRAPRGRLLIHRNMSARVLVLKLVPQMPKELLMSLVSETTAQAIVMCGFGSGNFPIEGRAVFAAASVAFERGIPVVVCTQVRYCAVDITSYEAGRQLVEAGVVGAGDMTVEAAVVKLKHLIGLGLSPRRVQALMPVDLRGEISTHQAKL